MRNPSVSLFDSIEYKPEVLEGRISHGETPEDFIKRLRPTQDIPCPWGSLIGKSDKEVYKKLFHWEEGPNDFPLALELGFGMVDENNPPSPGFGNAEITILSDYFEAASPLGLPQNYVQIDLTRPEQIDLGGIKCHFISASMVLTRDAWELYEEPSRYGVVWPSREIMRASLKAIPKLLLPNGLLSIDPPEGFLVNIEGLAEEENLDIFWLGRTSVILQKKC